MIRADRRILMALGALALALGAGAAWRAGWLPGSTAPQPHEREGEFSRRDGPVSVTTAPAHVQDVPVTIDEIGRAHV
jgi:multidrug efflux system membrane fusion protein